VVRPRETRLWLYCNDSGSGNGINGNGTGMDDFRDEGIEVMDGHGNGMVVL